MAENPIDKYLRMGSPEESSWRSVILFGRNVASYKFSLAQALFDLAKQNKDAVTLGQLADPYTRHLCEHVAHSPKQATSRSSKFIDACAGYNKGEVSHDQLIATAVQLGFNNVLDAFHVVNQGNVPVKFFEKDFSRGRKRLVLTDEVFKLVNSGEADNIVQETESRWNLVETAWEQSISSNLLRISYDELGQAFVAESDARRKDVTSARGSLNGYQKGHCFYCYAPIDAADGTVRTEDGLVLPPGKKPNLCDMDHFFPHALAGQVPEVNWDGVWNLVLACPDCNRGAGGKFARIPATEYLERLNRRNEYLIGSHHPLRETLIAQTGATPQLRWEFLKKVDRITSGLLPGERWKAEQREASVF